MLALQLSASALAEIAALGLQAVAAPGATTQPTWIAMVASVLNNLESVLLSPLYYIGLALLYFDRRVRAEGYDLTLRARALGQAVAPSDAV